MAWMRPLDQELSSAVSTAEKQKTNKQKKKKCRSSRSFLDPLERESAFLAGFLDDLCTRECLKGPG